MSFDEFIKIRQEKGQEALNTALKALTVEQMRDLIIETNKALINQAHLFVAAYIDYAVEANLEVSQSVKEGVDSLMKRIGSK